MALFDKPIIIGDLDNPSSIKTVLPNLSVGRLDSVPTPSEVAPSRAFCAGPLAGLTPEQRKAEQDKRSDLSSSFEKRSVEIERDLLQRYARESAPAVSLREYLQVDGAGSLTDIAAQYLSDEAYSSINLDSASDEALAQTLLKDFCSQERLEAELRMVPDVVAKAIKRLRDEGDYSCPDDDIPKGFYTEVLFPYFDIYHHEGRFVVSAPPEFLPLFGQIDFDAIEKTYAADDDVTRLVDNCMLVYGIAPLDEVYAVYQRAYPQGYSQDQFNEAVELFELTDVGHYGLWDYEGVCYLVTESLTDEDAQRRVRQREGTALADKMSDEAKDELADALSDKDREEPSGAMAEYLARLGALYARASEQAEEDRIELLEVQAEEERWPISEDLAKGDVFGSFCESREAYQLVAYVDAHLPEESADDLYFADRLVDDLTTLVLLDGMPDTMLTRVLISYGLAGCDGSGSDKLPNTLVRLAGNYYDSLPKWILNGWSVLGLAERANHGRRLFFKDDGTVLKPSRNEPCPCGSGKKYKRCHGR